MTNELCRICLSSDKKLEELNGHLLDYFHDICDYTSGFSQHMCCSECKNMLKDNLDFRNKCLKANNLLQEWKKSQKTTKIEALKKLLQSSLNDRETKDYPYKYRKNKICSKKFDIDDYNNKEIKVEVVKDEVNNSFEIINCGIEKDTEVNGLIVETVAKVDKSVSIQDQKDRESDLDHNDSDDLLSANRKHKVKKKTKLKIDEKLKKRVYPRKNLSHYSQYEDVFDIQLFSTDEEARRELVGRRVLEPYLSASHRCEQCYTVYKCKKLLQFHMKWHTGAGEFVCDICYMKFSVRKAVQCHKAKCHRGRFTCRLCPLITYYGSAMKAHFQKHQGKTFICHCDRVFNHISSYLSHKRTVHASNHVCVTCARTFVSELGLVNHRLRAHQTKSMVDAEGTSRCVPCGLTFATEQVYTVHVLNTPAHKEQAKQIIGCPYCGLSFEDVTQLKAHKRMKHPKKADTNDVIKCKLCDAAGVGRSWRRRHYRAAHPRARYLGEVSDARLVMCERCGKRFTNICLMKDHLNAHLGLKPYACGKCRATFSSKAARQAHVARHLSRDTVQDTRRRRQAASISMETTN